VKISVFGASGPTGQRIVSQALDQNHEVIAVARHPDAFDAGRPGLRVLAADVLDPGIDLVPAIAGADAVLSALGARRRRPTTVYSEGIRQITKAMEGAGVRRLVCISSEGIEISSGLPWAQRLVMRVIVQRLYRYAYADMADMESYLEASSLDWTVVRAPMLADGPATGRYQMALDAPLPNGGSLRRADLAQFMIDAVNQPETYRCRVRLASLKEKKRP
jgi:putative NADH-flavin reductase